MVKIDENYRAKLLAEGYEEDVIEFLVMDKFNAMREEFLEKNVILNRYYTKIICGIYG